jgi:hypothetical protein
MCFGRTSNSFSTRGTRHVTRFSNPATSHDRGKDRMLITFDKQNIFVVICVIDIPMTINNIMGATENFENLHLFLWNIVWVQTKFLHNFYIRDRVRFVYLTLFFYVCSSLSGLKAMTIGKLLQLTRIEGSDVHMQNMYYNSVYILDWVVETSVMFIFCDCMKWNVIMCYALYKLRIAVKLI